MTAVRMAARLARRRGRAPEPPTREADHDRRHSDAESRRRRRAVFGTAVAGTGLLGLSLSTPPGSRSFYLLTLGVAGTWTAGALASGPLPRRHRVEAPGDPTSGQVAIPVLVGAAAFGGFYGCARIARRVPMLNDAVARVLQFAERGATPLVVLTTCANGVAEELFFRGALYSVAGPRPVLASTVAYSTTTAATRNPALVLASVPMGALFALQRRATGGVQAPALTHVTWSVLMLRYLPPLFRRVANCR